MNNKKKCESQQKRCKSDINFSYCLQVRKVFWVSFFFKLLTDYTPCSRIFIVDSEQVNTNWVYSDFCICVRQIHEPCHIKMENFTITLNNF